jgi:hypothetical protein
MVTHMPGGHAGLAEILRGCGPRWGILRMATKPQVSFPLPLTAQPVPRQR